MRKFFPLAIPAFCFFALGCVPVAFLAIDNNVDNLVNYALGENGAIIEVNHNNAEHPASTLINGITSSDEWYSGEGWEVQYSRSIQRSCPTSGG
jgi:hypothetical protein